MTLLIWIGIALCIAQSAMLSGLNLALFTIGKTGAPDRDRKEQHSCMPGSVSEGRCELGHRARHPLIEKMQDAPESARLKPGSGISDFARKQVAGCLFA